MKIEVGCEVECFTQPELGNYIHPGSYGTVKEIKPDSFRVQYKEIYDEHGEIANKTHDTFKGLYWTHIGCLRLTHITNWREHLK